MIKIGGLVRAFNQVRATLQAGIPPAEQDNFRRQVRQIIRDVEEICAGHGHPSRILPGPSRMAYQFLKGIDLDNLPLREETLPGGPTGLPAAGPVSSVRIRNVVGIAESVSRQIWLNRDQLATSPPHFNEMHALLRQHTATIDEICREQGQTPAALEARTRVAYTYLSFAAGESNLRSILAALARAADAARGYSFPAGQPLMIDLLGMNSLWRFRRFSNALILRASLGFINAEADIWRALLASIFGHGSSRDRQSVTEFTMSEDFSDVLFEVEALAAPPTPVTRGRVYDLAESFARVNQLYFEGRMDQPILCWNQTLTSRKFGHYQPSRDTIMISVSLDSPQVSSMLLDFVMYHELLHKRHGCQLVNGRRIAHTAAFRADERLFRDWQRAEQELTQLATRLATGR